LTKDDIAVTWYKIHMTVPNHHQNELKDAGDAWLAFFAISVLATIILTPILWQNLSLYWSLAAAVALAMVIGWVISLIRPVRKMVSEIVQWPWDCIAIFS
jgi:branched-subunit amino acid transport protein